MTPAVERLAPGEAPEAVAVLCEAFHDYPVMRHVLGGADGYDDRLARLVTFFCAARRSVRIARPAPRRRSRRHAP